MKNWYAIKAKADDTAEITIFDEIGIWGVTAKSFIADLKAISAKTITLSVNSPGGSVFDGFAIYNALKNARENGVTINARIMGIAASAASFIVMAANSIEMPENSMMMVHYASGLAWGNSEDLRDTADILDKIDASLVGIYTARTGKSEEDVRALLQAETYLTAQEAKDAGFADTVTPNVKASATFEIDRLPANVQALFKAAQEPVGIDPAPAADRTGHSKHCPGRRDQGSLRGRFTASRGGWIHSSPKAARRRARRIGRRVGRVGREHPHKQCALDAQCRPYPGPQSRDQPARLLGGTTRRPKGITEK